MADAAEIQQRFNGALAYYSPRRWGKTTAAKQFADYMRQQHETFNTLVQQTSTFNELTANEAMKMDGLDGD